jgi:hypothetical protein
MKWRIINIGLCLLIIFFILNAGCTSNNGNNNLPPEIHIQVKEEVYSNTTFCFNVYVEDPDGNVAKIRVQWDFEDDDHFDWDSDRDDCYLDIENGHFKQCHSYGSPGEYKALLKVTDKDCKCATKKCNISVTPYALSLEADLDKNVYLIDESIILTVTIHNDGSLPINVSEMGFYYSTLGGSEINTPEGYIIQSMIYVECMPLEITIDNNGQYMDTFDLLGVIWGIRDDEEWTEYNLTQRGKYSIEVIYDSYPHGEVWNGEMRVEPITFLII